MDNASSLIQLIESPLHNPHTTPMVYRVRPGDTLQKIIRQHYGITPGDARYRFAETSMMYFNANLKKS